MSQNAPVLYRVLRRVFDIVAAVVLLALLAPLILVLVVLVRITSPGPSIFAQVRIGRAGRPFRCYKLRTMVVDADQRLARLLEEDPALALEWHESQKLRNDPRINSVGRFLRKTNLDELPQLVNVLLGQMSLIGPRPVVPVETERYGSWLSTVLSVRPGLTGSWQVGGRSDVSYGERVRLDVEYVERPRLRTDACILAKTALTLVRPGGRGAY